VPTHGARKENFLDIAASGRQALKRIPVRDSLNVLLDDGSVIENFGHVVCGGADQFDSALVSLNVRLPPTNAGKKE
jgi:hypothetical protein